MPVGKAMQLGTDTHSQLESYLKEGTSPDTEKDHGRIAAKGLRKLNELNIEPLKVEVEVSLEKLPLREPFVIPFKGYIDVLDRDSNHILDHKTISNNRSALSEDELKNNIQMIVYAKHFLDNKEDATEVRITHLYFNTKNKKEAFEVSTKISREEVEQKWSDIRAVVIEIKQFSDLMQTLEWEEKEEEAGIASVFFRGTDIIFPLNTNIESNTNSCNERFMPCAFADICSTYKPNYTKEEDTSFLKSLIANLNSKANIKEDSQRESQQENKQMNEDNLINKIASTTSRRSKYISEGEYVLKVDNLLSGLTKAGRQFIAIEFEDITGCENTPGTMVTHLMLADQNSTAKNIRDFLCKVLNVSDDKLTEQMIRDAFTPDSRGFSVLRGMKVRCIARDVKTKKGGDYTIINYKVYE